MINTLRKPKIFGMAIFDIVATYYAAYLVAKKYNMCPKKTFLAFVALGVIVHKQMNIPTMLNYYLGINTLDEVLKSRN